MDVRRIGCVIVFLILLCVIATASPEGWKRTKQLNFFLSNRASAYPGIDDNMAEQLWINCRLDVMYIKESIESFDLYLPDKMSIGSKEIKSKERSKDNLQKAIRVLPPQIKQTFLDCLREHNIAFHVSGEEVVSKNWYTKYLESLFSWPDDSRRYLSGELLEIGATPAPAPSPGVQPPTYGPAPSSDPAPPSSEEPPVESPRPFFPTNLDSNVQPSPIDLTPHPPPKKEQSNKTVIVAVVVTASVTFIFAALLFYCYHKCRSNSGSGDGPKDESPLLSLSLSDYSVGSSHKSFAVENSTNKEKFGSLSFSKLSQNGRPLAESSAAPTNGYTPVSTPPLKPPPGRAAPPSHGSPLPPPIPSGVKPAHRPPPPPMGAPPRPPPPPMGSVPRPPSPPMGAPPHPSPHPIGSAPRPPPPPTGAPPPPPMGSVPCPPPPPMGAPPHPSPPPIGSAPRPPPPPMGAPPRPPPPPMGSAPRPPPPPMGTAPRPPPPLSGKSKVTPPSPVGPSFPGTSGAGVGANVEADAPKTKLKPFFWDKVLANPDHSMVWHQIRSGSFQFNEEMIENLFGYNAADKNKTQPKKEFPSQDTPMQYVQIIDSKKAQNLAILLRALNVTTEEVCDALQEGNELSVELLQTLAKMAPTKEEELKLSLYSGDLSQLGPAERFLKVLVDIPFAFKRMDSLCFMSSLQEEVSSIKESLANLEVACKELKNSRLFLKILEAVLKTGNRMNDGTFRGGAQAFKLDTLLKLADVKGTDGKTTLLHFVVQEIIRSEGVRAARAASESQSLSSVRSEDLVGDSPHESGDHYRSLGLQVVSGLGGELENVKKAASLDADGITGTVSKLGQELVKSRAFLNSDMKSLGEDSGFYRTLRSFVEHAEVDIMWLLEEEKRIMALVKRTAEYFHGNARHDEGLRLFVIVRDFLIMIDKICKEVRESAMKLSREQRNRETPRMPPSPELHKRLFPAIMDRRMDSSDDESSSP